MAATAAAAVVAEEATAEIDADKLNNAKSRLPTPAPPQGGAGVGFFVRIAEAAKGQGEAKKTLAELNIELRDQQGILRDSDDILKDFADALKGTATDGERLRAGGHE